MRPIPTKHGFVRADEAQCPNREATLVKSHTAGSVVIPKAGAGAPGKTSHRGVLEIRQKTV